MSRKSWRGIEEAPCQLRALLEHGAGGIARVIVRHARPIAALVPLETYDAGGRQQSILPLASSGRRLWGRRSAAKVGKLRDEYSR